LQKTEEGSHKFNFTPFAAFDFGIILSEPNPPDPDSIPYWFLQALTSHLRSVVRLVVDNSLLVSCGPSAWCQAVSTRIRETMPITEPTDFRSTSVTSLLSRITEQLLLNDSHSMNA
jgi:hypothetical protein